MGTVALTEAGRRAYEQLESAYDTAIADLLGQFSDADQASLVGAMDVVGRLVNAVRRR